MKGQKKRKMYNCIVLLPRHDNFFTSTKLNVTALRETLLSFWYGRSVQKQKSIPVEVCRFGFSILPVSKDIAETGTQRGSKAVTRCTPQHFCTSLQQKHKMIAQVCFCR